MKTLKKVTAQNIPLFAQTTKFPKAARQIYTNICIYIYIAVYGSNQVIGQKVSNNATGAANTLVY